MKNIRPIVSMLTYRKIPLLIAYELLVVMRLYFSNPTAFKMTLYIDGWLFGLGFLSLAFLAFFEKRKGIPLPYAEPMSKSNYLITTLVCLFSIQAMLRVSEWLMATRLVPGSISMAPFSNIITFIETIQWQFQFAVVEESFKMALTNVFGIPSLLMQSKTLRTIWVFGAGTVSVFIWTYLHILMGAFSGEHMLLNFLLAFIGGMIFLTITMWKKNYLPAVLIHGIHNVALTFGYVF